MNKNPLGSVHFKGRVCATNSSLPSSLPIHPEIRSWTILKNWLARNIVLFLFLFYPMLTKSVTHCHMLIWMICFWSPSGVWPLPAHLQIWMEISSHSVVLRLSRHFLLADWEMPNSQNILCVIHFLSWAKSRVIRNV